MVVSSGTKIKVTVSSPPAGGPVWGWAGRAEELKAATASRNNDNDEGSLRTSHRRFEHSTAKVKP